FQCNRTLRVFRSGDDLFGDAVVGVRGEAALFATPLPVEPPGAAGKLLGEFGPQSPVPTPQVVEVAAGVAVSVAVGGDIDDPQVTPQRPFRFSRWRRRKVNRHEEVENAVAPNQVGLSLGTVETRRLIRTVAQGNQFASPETKERNVRQSLEGHDPL